MSGLKLTGLSAAMLALSIVANIAVGIAFGFTTELPLWASIVESSWLLAWASVGGTGLFRLARQARSRP